VNDEDSVKVAIELLRDARVLDPDSKTIANNLGAAYRTQGHFDQAQKEFERAVKIDETYAAAYVNLGDVLERQGQIPAAVIQYRLAMRAAGQTDDPSTHMVASNNLSRLLIELGRAPEALEVLRPVVAKYPQYAVLRKNLGLAFLGAGKIDSAQVSLETARDLDTKGTYRQEIDAGLQRVAAARDSTAPN
jgi:tetratricopeptide (TPR) repeat protein